MKVLLVLALLIALTALWITLTLPACAPRSSLILILAFLSYSCATLALAARAFNWALREVDRLNHFDLTPGRHP